MASAHSKMSRAIAEFKRFLDYNNSAYYEASLHIQPKEGWRIPYYSNEIFDLATNMEGRLYEGIYPKLTDNNPASDEEILRDFKGALRSFVNEGKVFNKIVREKKKNKEELFFYDAEGIIHDLLYKAIYKLQEVIQLAEEDLLRRHGQDQAVAEDSTEFTICILTATTDEYKSLKSKIPNSQPIPSSANDSQIYQRGTIQGRNNLLINTVFTQCHYQGLSSASNVATKMILNFKPKLMVMVGHAAGNKNLKRTLNIGDILICKEAVDYDSVILSDKGAQIVVKEKPNPVKADATLIQLIRNFALDSDKMRQLKNKCVNFEIVSNELGFKEGKIISGDALARSSQWFDRIVRDNHEAIGLDMETFGLYYASENTIRENKPLFISLKSVSDFGGSDDDIDEAIKDPKVRVPYAIDTSINFFLDFAKESLPI